MNVRIDQVFYTNIYSRGRSFEFSSYEQKKEDKHVLLSAISRFGNPSELAGEEIIFSRYLQNKYLFCKYKTLGNEAGTTRKGQIYHLLIIESTFLDALYNDFSFLNYILNKHVKWFKSPENGVKFNSINLSIDIDKELDEYIKYTKILFMSSETNTEKLIKSIGDIARSDDWVIPLNLYEKQIISNAIPILLPTAFGKVLTLSTYAYQPEFFPLFEDEIVIYFSKEIKNKNEQGNLIPPIKSATRFIENPNIQSYKRLKNIPINIWMKESRRKECEEKSYTHKPKIRNRSLIKENNKKNNFYKFLIVLSLISIISTPVLLPYFKYNKLTSISVTENNVSNLRRKYISLFKSNRFLLSRLTDIRLKIKELDILESNFIISSVENSPECSITKLENYKQLQSKYPELITNVIQRKMLQEEKCLLKKEIIADYNSNKFKNDISALIDKIFKYYSYSSSFDMEIYNVYLSVQALFECQSYKKNILSHVASNNYSLVKVYSQEYLRNKNLFYYKREIIEIYKLIQKYPNKIAVLMKLNFKPKYKFKNRITLEFINSNGRIYDAKNVDLTYKSKKFRTSILIIWNKESSLRFKSERNNSIVGKIKLGTNTLFGLKKSFNSPFISIDIHIKANNIALPIACPTSKSIAKRIKGKYKIE